MSRRTHLILVDTFNKNILETFSNLEADKVDTKKKIPKELLMNLKESLKTEPNRVNTIELNLQITEVNNSSANIDNIKKLNEVGYCNQQVVKSKTDSPVKNKLNRINIKKGNIFNLK
ncbi:hypothetical protein C2G38_2164445 [Gigaspora rosea]|uniref:Uncharacterized protein n=1 Tax=Gigaspora rosea TaxID=44941 RepID=A0A397VWC2_9GLOM|nr:hypothetical protein C2G38_2164445 [Gigaspora rosea]